MGLPLVNDSEQTRTSADANLKLFLNERGESEVLIAALEAFPGAAFIVDGERAIRWWSQGAEALLGFGAEQVLGEHCLKSNRCQQCIQGCGVEEHGAIDGVPLILFNGEGKPVPVKNYARVLRGADGRFAGSVELLLPDAPQPPIVDLVEDHEAVERFHGLVTADPEMKRVLRTVRDVADTDVSVLIRGESGTGKELIARAIHAESHRAAGPFVAVNCAALSPSLLESELFGHERGAFSGAVRQHQGVFEQAHGGTLFLDEIGELPLELQAKLLRVLQERRFVRVGGTKPLDVDVRILSATHKSLRDEATAGRFREDLLYRLRVVPVYLPPLRARRGDLPVLIDELQHHLAGSGRLRPFSPEAMRVLLEHRWPGNVRELLNVLQYAAVVGAGDTLTVDDLPPELRPAGGHDQVARYCAPRSHNDEREAIRRALDDNDGHIGRAAAALGMSRPTLWRRRKKYGL
jgi:transcriptional regulator with PAS, ATPase and Fis domain